MPTFKCNNSECKDFGKEELVPRARFVWNDKESRFESDQEICPTCGQRRETVREQGPIQIPWFKGENARNYDNKKIKKYDYDKQAYEAESTPVKLSKENILKTAQRN